MLSLWWRKEVLWFALMMTFEYRGQFGADDHAACAPHYVRLSEHPDLVQPVMQGKER